VAYDFRQADVASGGQGAPIVPVFHQALARDLARPHPIAVFNLGGVANVTYRLLPILPRAFCVASRSRFRKRLA
jgi:1,6-anhydro-N-acetylmuramate kinase